MDNLVKKYCPVDNSLSSYSFRIDRLGGWAVNTNKPSPLPVGSEPDSQLPLRAESVYKTVLYILKNVAVTAIANEVTLEDVLCVALAIIRRVIDTLRTSWSV